MAADPARCRNPRCNEGWVERGDNESGGAPAFRCRTDGCPYGPAPRLSDREGYEKHAAPENINARIVQARERVAAIERELDWLEGLYERRVAEKAEGRWP